MPSINVTADNLPKDSGNRYVWAPFDPSASAFNLPLSYPVSGSLGGLAQGHVVNNIADLITATGAISSGVDLGGWAHLALYVPPMGSGTQLTFQASASGIGWTNISTALINHTATISATGALAVAYFVGMGPQLEMLRPFRFVRMSAAQNQTATRTAVWVVMS